MEVKEYRELEKLFWKWCKTFSKYNDFSCTKRTLKDVLDLISHDVYSADAQMIRSK